MATRVTFTKKGDTFTVRSPGLDPHDREYIFRTTKAAAARKAAEDRVAVLSEANFDVECDWEETVFKKVKVAVAKPPSKTRTLNAQMKSKGHGGVRVGDIVKVIDLASEFLSPHLRVDSISGSKFKDDLGRSHSISSVVLVERKSPGLTETFELVKEGLYDPHGSFVYSRKIKAARPQKTSAAAKTKKPWWQFW